MTPITTGIVAFGVLLVLMALGMPIGFAMLLLGFTGFTYLVKLSGALHIIINVPYTLISGYDFSVLPLFLFMASICLAAGLGKSLFYMAYNWLGRLPGGLSVATIGACAIFGAASASGIATAATIGMVAIPEMQRYKYESGLAAGCVAAGGTLGIMIPPSGILIIYGILAQQDIAKLFIAGIIPGILLSLMFVAMVYIRVRLNPAIAPIGPQTSLKEKFGSIGNSIEMIVLILLVIVGLIIGWFTPTEAGAAGAFGAIVLSLIRRRLSWQGFKNATIETIRNTGMIFTILIGALVFTSFLAVTTLPMEVAEWITGLGLPPLSVMIMILLLYLAMGTFLEEMAMILLSLPIFYPVVVALGFDPIWFGIVIVLVVEMGMISPPVGITMFVVKGIAPDISMGTIFKGVLPFWLITIVFAGLLVAFPQLALFLPSIAGG
jgi:C4-dicarboxylate transporter DctM subunit